MTNTDLENRTLSLTRTFNARIETVWEAWTKPEHLAKWWGRGMPVTIAEHDFREGGAWKYTMPMPDGSEFVSEGVYSEIVEMEKIVSSANFRPMTEGVTIEAHFEADGNKTNFTFKVIHATEDYARAQEKMGFFNGWGSVFEVLDSFLMS